MPYQITENDDRCPASEPWSVVKQTDNELMGCHASKDDAQDQLAALNANEADDGRSAMGEAPREDLHRSVPFTLTRAKEGGDGLTLEGYAATFDSPTLIDSWEGYFNESIQRGAFARVVRDSRQWPIMQFDHGRHPMIGSIPLGVVRHMREDERGLFVRTRLTDNWLVQPVRDAISAGAVSGMSFRFSVIRDKWDHTGDIPLRTLQQVNVAELGPVVWPAYGDTEVSVRAREYAELLQDPDERQALANALLERQDPVDEWLAPDEASHTADAQLHSEPPSSRDDAQLSDEPPSVSEERKESDAQLSDEPPSAETQPSRLSPARLRRDAQFRRDYLALITKGTARYER